MTLVTWLPLPVSFAIQRTDVQCEGEARSKALREWREVDTNKCNCKRRHEFVNNRSSFRILAIALAVCFRFLGAAGFGRGRSIDLFHFRHYFHQ